MQRATFFLIIGLALTALAFQSIDPSSPTPTQATANLLDGHWHFPQQTTLEVNNKSVSFTLPENYMLHGIDPQSGKPVEAQGGQLVFNCGGNDCAPAVNYDFLTVGPGSQCQCTESVLINGKAVQQPAVVVNLKKEGELGLMYLASIHPAAMYSELVEPSPAKLASIQNNKVEGPYIKKAAQQNADLIAQSGANTPVVMVPYKVEGNLAWLATPITLPHYVYGKWFVNTQVPAAQQKELVQGVIIID